MTKQEADFIGSMNMCDEISNEAYKKIMCHCEVEEEEFEDYISRESVIEWLKDKDIIKTKNQEENARRELAELPSVTPSYNSIKTELDCISRQEVLDVLKDKWNMFSNSNDAMEESIDTIKALPPVTPIPLPKNATNGDMIKAMFPDVKVKEKNNVYEVYFGFGTAIQFFNRQWWNAPYKAENKTKQGLAYTDQDTLMSAT